MFIGGDGRQRLVDDAQQRIVVAGHRKGKTPGLHGREVRQVYVVQVISADQVMGIDRIAQVDIGLAESHGAHRRQCRRKQLDLRPGIELLHAVFGQVVIQHHQPLAGQCRVAHRREIGARDQHRLIDRVRAGHL
ncbi:hypothetical protein D3C79_900110 [compost metagenome]